MNGRDMGLKTCKPWLSPEVPNSPIDQFKVYRSLEVRNCFRNTGTYFKGICRQNDCIKYKYFTCRHASSPIILDDISECLPIYHFLDSR